MVIYWASDFHLGGFGTCIKEQERKVLRWLDEISGDVECLILAGDIFDFWFEYRYVVPKHFIRFLGKIAQLVDQGVQVHFFTGNHDMWMFDYLEHELGVHIHRELWRLETDGKVFVTGHGDGLGPGDQWYKWLVKPIFRASIFQNAFAYLLHPDIAFGIAHFFSKTSRKSQGHKDDVFLGVEGEWLLNYCLEDLKINPKPADYYIFGHRHLPMHIQLGTQHHYINLGQWINQFTYCKWDGAVFSKHCFEAQTSFLEQHVEF